MAAAPAMTKAPSDTGGSDRQPESVVSFRRASGEGRYTFEVQAPLLLSANAQDLGPIDIKAYDYMRSILLLVQTTAAGTSAATAYQPDGPFNVITYIRVKQPNGQTMYSVTSGHHAAMIHKHSFSRAEVDPRGNGQLYSAVAGTAPSFAFAIRIPFELDLRDALGALPNKDAAAPFSLEIGLNTLSNVFTVVPSVSPTFKITPILEAYDQPPSSLDGKGVETTPPNMNTLQRWTEQTVTMVSGAFDAKVKKLGNYVRELIFITKSSAGARLSDATGWGDPVQIVLDEDVKDNIPLALWRNDVYETWGYGGQAGGSVAVPALDTAGGQDTGVFPYQYCVNRRTIEEDVAAYLPTIESEDYLLRSAVWGASVSKMTILKCEVLPRGDIFGDV